MSENSKREPERLGPEAPYRRHSTLWVCLALVSGVVLLYGQVAGHEFVNLDDPKYIFENPHVRQGLTSDGVRWAFAEGQRGNWHPLTSLSHMLDAELFGLKPGGPHLINVALHASNTVLLFLALRWMTGAFWPCALVAALFAVHPLRVESVAWASERKDVLSGLFWMLTLSAYAAYVRRPSRGRYGLVFTTLGLGLMAKPMGVTLPFVLLLLDFWPLGRRRPLQRLVLEKLPLLGLSAASSVVTVLAQQSHGQTYALGALPIGSRLANALLAYVAYLRKTILPVDLAAFYPHAALASPDALSALLGPAIGAGLALGGISAGVIYLAARRPYLAVGWFWYLGTLLPVIGLVQVGAQAMADRYTYLPLVGIFIAVAWGLWDLAARGSGSRRVVTAASAVALLACMTATWFQVGTWRNSVLLWEHAVRVTRDNYLAHNHLGAAFLSQGNLAQAAAQLERALRIRPSAGGHTNLGAVFLKQGRLAQATAQFERAVRLRPDFAQPHMNLGVVLARQEKLAEAATQYERALHIKPDYAEAHINLGLVFFKQGDLAAAAAHYEQALRINPNEAQVQYNLGVVFLRQGSLVEAAAEFESALRIKPDLAEAHHGLGVVLWKQGDLAQAAAQFESALRIKPSYADARQHLERVRARLGTDQ